jgi:hypothetical protein
MGQELISKKTRNEFREYLVGWTLRTIANEFDAADIACDNDFQPPTSGERRSLVEQYYHSLDLTDPGDARKILRAFENILISIANSSHPYFSPQQKEADLARLSACLRRDGYAFENGCLIPVTGTGDLVGLRATAVEFSAEYMTQQIKRMETAVDSDPAHAIGSAKEPVETCCRTILSDRGKPVQDRPDVLPLVRRTMEELKLVPEGIPEEAKCAKTIKAILGNLATVAQGLVELRNLYGTGHGKHGRAKGLYPRHARLAVGAAAALVMFLFDTHKERDVTLEANR